MDYGIIVAHFPSKPKEFDKWPKELPHPKQRSRKTWKQLYRLRGIFQLHLEDAYQILSAMVPDTQVKKLKDKIQEALGPEWQLLGAGWEAIKKWTDWAKVTGCLQKPKENVCERYKQIILEYSDVPDVTEDNYDNSSYVSLKSTFLYGLNLELSRLLKATHPDCAVKLSGKKRWIHANHCKRVKFDAEERSEVKCWQLLP